MAKQVVVIGAGLGGLSAAIHARLRGFDVLLLERSGASGGKAARISQGGYRFDPGPSIIVLTQIYDSVFERAGRRREDYLQFQRLDPIAQVYFEGREPLVLPADRKQLVGLVRSFAPHDADSLERLFLKLDRITPKVFRSVFRKPYHAALDLADANLMALPLGLGIGKRYKAMVDSWFSSPILRAFFYGFPSYGGQTYDSNAPGAFMIPYLMAEEGAWFPTGGVSAIPAAFEALARELGVEIRFGTDVCGLEMRGSRVAAALLSGRERIEADSFISNVDRSTTRGWLGFPVPQRPSLSYFTLQWGVKRRWPDIAHHTLLVPSSFEQGFEQLYRRREFPDRPIVYLNETAGVDPASAPADCSNLLAVVSSPAIEPGLDWSAESGPFRRRVLEVMRVFGIEIEPSEVDVELIQTPRTFQVRDGNFLGSLYGPDESERLFGLFPERCKDEQVHNLLYAGASVQPGAGLPMVTLSGKFAADLL